VASPRSEAEESCAAMGTAARLQADCWECGAAILGDSINDYTLSLNSFCSASNFAISRIVLRIAL
jgi:hypothetical protein